jgi:hypothetical protein
MDGATRSSRDRRSCGSGPAGGGAGLLVDEFEAEKSKLLEFPEARITYVRCEVAKAAGSARPAGCQ